MLRLQTTGCNFKHSLDLNILLLPLFFKETCVTSGTQSSFSCSLCVGEAPLSGTVNAVLESPPLTDWRLIWWGPGTTFQRSQCMDNWTKIVCIHFINYKKRDTNVLILLSQSSYFYLKEKQDFLLAQTNQQFSKLDRFVFISEQSVRRYPSPALHNSLAIVRGWSAFEDLPRALLELSRKAQDMWRDAL